MIDWTKPYTTEFLVNKIDQMTWTPVETVRRVVSVGVERNCKDSVSLLESGSMEVDGGFEDGWYRISCRARQGFSSEFVDVCTMFFESRGNTIDSRLNTFACDGYSVLLPASKRLIDAGTYVSKGEDGAQRAALLLRECIYAPVEVEGSFALDSNYVFDIGSSYLTAAWTLLNAGGFVISIEGDGTVVIKERPSNRLIGIGSLGLMPIVSRSRDLSSVPNRFVAVRNGVRAVAIDDDPDSPTSLANRHEVTAVETSPTPLDGESLQAYAERRLRESKEVKATYSYSRAYRPNIGLWDIIEEPFEGERMGMRVVAQSLEIGSGITVKETSEVIDGD